MFNNDSLSPAGYKWAAAVRAACTETPQCDGHIPTAPEQHPLGAAFRSWKKILGSLIEDPQQRNPGTPIFDIWGVCSSAGQSHGQLGDKQGHLAMWNLNSKGVKFQTKSMSPLKCAWPFPSHPFGFPLRGPQRARGALPVHGPVLEAGASWFLAWPNWEPSFRFPDKDPSLLLPTQGAKQRRGAICPSVRAVIEPSTAPLPFCHIPPLICHCHSQAERGREQGLTFWFGPWIFTPNHFCHPCFLWKIHLPHFQVANEAGSGWSSSGCSDQPAVEKHHLKPKYFLQQTQPETVKKTKSGCLCCPKITPMSGLENGPSPSRKMLLFPRLKGKKKSFLKLLFFPLLST